MLGQSIFSGYVSFAIVVIIVRHALKKSGAQMLLAGVKTYYCADPAVGRLSTEDLRSKKARKAYEKKQLQIKGAQQQIYVQGMGPNSLRSLLHADDLETLVIMGLSVFLNTAVLACMAVLSGTTDTALVLFVLSIFVLLCVFTVLKVDLVTVQGSSSKLVLFLFMGGGALVSLFTLLQLPHFTIKGSGVTAEQNAAPSTSIALMDWKLTEAAQGFDAMVGAIHYRLRARLAARNITLSDTIQGVVEHPPQMGPSQPWMVAVSVGAFAGLLAAALLGPAMRYARLLHSALNVPSWGKDFIQQRWLAIKIMQLGFVLPLGVVLVQLRPISAHWGLTDDTVSQASASLMLLTGVTHLLALRHLSQTYLNTGLVEWHTLLHNGHKSETKMGMIKLKLDVLRALLGKAATQLLGLGLLLVGLGLLVFINCGTLQQVAERSTELRASIHAQLPSGIVKLLNGTGAAAAMPAAPVADPAVVPDVSSGVEELIGLSDEEADAPAVLKAATNAVAKAAAAVAVEPRALWLFLGQYLGWWASFVWCLYAYCAMGIYRTGMNVA